MKKNKGFTLLEITLAIGMVSLLSLGAVNFMSTVSKTKAKSQAIREVQEQGRFAILSMEKALREAEAVLSPAPGASAPALSLDTVDLALDPTVFSLSSEILSVTEGVNPAVNLTNDSVLVESLSFTNLASSGAPASIKIETTVSYNAPDNSQFSYSETFYSTITLRLR